MVLHGPEVPVVHDRAGEQDADATGDAGEHCKPPGPTVNRFHRGVKAHRPAPEEASALRGGAAVDDLLDLALATVTAHGQNGGAVHGKEQHRSIEKGNREHVERVVEQVAVAQ